MRVLAFDYETCLLQPGQAAPPAVVLSTTDRPGWGSETLAHARFNRTQVRDTLGIALSDKQTLVAGANVEFDLGVTVREFPELWETVFDAYEQNRVIDVLHNQKLIDIATDDYFKNRGSYNLGALAKRLCGYDLEKDTWRLYYGKFMDVPLERFVDHARIVRPHDPNPQGVIEYPRWDARSTYDALGVQCTHHNDLLEDAYRQARAGWWIYLMHAHGFKTDLRQVQSLRRRVEKERDELAFVLRAHGLLRLDGTRNTKAAADRMVEVCNAKGIAVKMTEGGEESEPGVALDEDACLVAGDDVLKSYARYSSLNTIYTKDIPALSKPLIQARFEVLVETGRTSCSGGKSKGKGKAKALDEFQLQNVRKEPGVRECFVPRDGNWLLSVDYGQMELHAWSQACLRLVNFSAMAEALNRGIDVHVLFGCTRVNGLDYDESVKNKKKDPYKDHRQMAKAANFGFPGGLGAGAFMEYARATYGVIIEKDRAKSLRREWMETWPESDAYFNFVKGLVGHDRNYGTVSHLFSNRLRGGVHFTNACNSYFQGLAADTAKAAGFLLSRACYVDRNSVLYGSRIVNFVHDEFILEVPIHLAHECAQETVRLMEQAGRQWMPDVPPRAEPALMKRWMKAAEPVYDANKRLIPWEPKEKAA